MKRSRMKLSFSACPTCGLKFRGSFVERHKSRCASASVEDREIFKRTKVWPDDPKRNAVDPTQRKDWCDECGDRHSHERRRAILARMNPDVTAEEVREAWGYHLWPPTEAGSALLSHDLRAVFGVRKRPSTTLEQKARLIEIISSGVPVGHAAHRIGISATVARDYACAAGVSRPRRSA